MRQRTINSVKTNDDQVLHQAKRLLRNVDVYPKLHKEFKVQTKTGATVSVVTLVLMMILFLSELRDYLVVQTKEHMMVDSTISDKLRINYDVSYLALNCKDTHLNSMDVAGELQINMNHDISKIRLDKNGKEIGVSSVVKESVLPPDYCGSCYGAQHPDGLKCCNSCDSIKEAYVSIGWSMDDAETSEQCQREASKAEKEALPGEGCKVSGSLYVNRVSGNVHVALGRTFSRNGRLVHQFQPGQQLSFNSSHRINSLSFGEPYPSIMSPLQGRIKIAHRVGSVFQYYIKIVPTIFQDENNLVTSNQYTYTEQERFLDPYGPMSVLPGVFFIYDLSPFMVQVETSSIPLTHFLTKVCAIIGGMLSISGLIDSFLYHQRKKTSQSGHTVKEG